MPHKTPQPVKEIISNPVVSRTDLVNLLHSLIAPLADAQSDGGARIRIGHTGTHFDTGAAEFEGYARALWGLTPLWAAEPDRPEFVEWRERWIEGMRNGTDREHEEYWGDVRDRDQRMVEIAAVGLSLCMAPSVFWDPLNDKQKKALETWMLPANNFEYPDNNWRCKSIPFNLCMIYFRVLLNLGLASVGANHSTEAITRELDFMESFYGPHGFPADGVQPQSRGYDYYSHSFAITFYSLIYAKLQEKQDPKRAALYRQRAVQNLPFVAHLYGTDGAAIPYGRSMIYRFACCAFFAALAFDGQELPAPFTWGIIKGIVLRHIRWFTQRESIFYRDGSLSIGWAYPQTYLSEDYNSAQSPYWALKPFLVLALPETHPFWAATEEPYPDFLLQKAFYPAPQWGQVFSHSAGHDFMLSSGAATNWPMRGHAAKYHKLAYSAQFGFSLPSGHHGLMGLAPDNTLVVRDMDAAAPNALSAQRWIQRDHVESYKVLEGGVVSSVWKPFSDASITTYLAPPQTTSTPYHTRIHLITSSRTLQVLDGGWAIHSHTPTSASAMSERRLPILDSPDGLDGTHHGRWQSANAALVHSKAGISGVVDLLGNASEARVLDADGCTNVIAPRTIIPGVFHSVEKGKKYCLATRVWGVPFKAGEAGGQWMPKWKDGVDMRYESVDELVKDLGLSEVLKL